MFRFKGSDSGDDDSSVSKALEAKLVSLPFKAFRNCVVLWLGGIGYSEIRSLGRRHRRGRRQVGGADFIVSIPGVFSSKVAIQVRHWRTPIQRRAVDELRGFMLRHNVPSGLIVASEEFSRKARQTASSFPGRPITAVGPRQLAESMCVRGQGVLPQDGSKTLDERYFRSLERLGFADSRTFEHLRRHRFRQANRQPGSPESASSVYDCETPQALRKLLLALAGVLVILATVLQFFVHRRLP